MADTTIKERIKEAVIVFIKVVCLIGFLYLFICTLGFLSDGFKLVGGKTAGRVFRENEILRNPVASLTIGVLATVLLQSSSTTTSIIITMVGSEVIPIKTAIPMVMGANIGTSVTNTIVSLAQSRDRQEFRKAFAGATVHDMFNLLGVATLLPLEIVSDYLYHLTGAIVNNMDLTQTSGRKQDMLKKITKPFTSRIVKINKRVIYDIAARKTDAEDVSVLKRWCKFRVIQLNHTMEHTRLSNYTIEDMQSADNVRGIDNGTTGTLTWTSLEVRNRSMPIQRCKNLFAQTDLSDNVIGILLIVISLSLIVMSLVAIVKILNSLLKGSIAKIVKNTVNADFPGKFAFLTGYVAILVGTGMTMVIQSSSIFTSTLTPLVGVGVVSLERMYPLTLGANIGTTLTGILVALAASADEIRNALQISLCHLFFNVTSMMIYYPIPVTRKAPIGLSMMLGDTAAKYRWFSAVYLIVVFLLLPGTVFGLSLGGTIVLLAVGIPLLLLLVLIIIINSCQRKCSKCLPQFLQNWNFLPLCLHSLDPYDRFIVKTLDICKCRQNNDKETPTKTDNIVLDGQTNKAYQQNV